MKERMISIPQIMLIAGTRVMLGIGIGLLLSGKLNEGSRRGAGWGLLMAGVVTTGPLVANLLCSKESGPARASFETAA